MWFVVACLIVVVNASPLVESMKGTINWSERIGQGATFSYTQVCLSREIWFSATDESRFAAARLSLASSPFSDQTSPGGTRHREPTLSPVLRASGRKRRAASQSIPNMIATFGCSGQKPAASFPQKTSRIRPAGACATIRTTRTCQGLVDAMASSSERG